MLVPFRLSNSYFKLSSHAWGFDFEILSGGLFSFEIPKVGFLIFKYLTMSGFHGVLNERDSLKDNKVVTLMAK